MKPLYEIIRRPLITEKSVAMKDTMGRYCFEVAPEASKGAIRQALESAFSVKVTYIRTMVVRGKMRRMGRHQGRSANWKKAIVKLHKEDKIEFF